MPNQTRQLAAIMFTDIVGYTALMQQNEQKAVALIRHYNTALNQKVEYHLGRVLNYYGDGSLCTFSSVTEAVNCALDLQKDLQFALQLQALRAQQQQADAALLSAFTTFQQANTPIRCSSYAVGNTVQTICK